MRIEVKGELPDLNSYINAERGNRYGGAKIKKEATNIVAWQVMNMPKITEPKHFHFHWYVKNKRKDPDNVAFACKFVLDGLQAAGVLPKDSMAWVLSLHHTYSVGEPRVVLTLK